jgi:hypothetical protein
LPYTFLFHEAPLVDGSSSWIASGWQYWHLDLIWIVLTISIYVVSALFWLFWNRRKQQKYHKFISLSVITLSFTSIFFRFIFPFILFALFTLVPLSKRLFWFRNWPYCKASHLLIQF